MLIDSLGQRVPRPVPVVLRPRRCPDRSRVRRCRAGTRRGARHPVGPSGWSVRGSARWWTGRNRREPGLSARLRVTAGGARSTVVRHQLVHSRGWYSHVLVGVRSTRSCGRVAVAAHVVRPDPWPEVHRNRCGPMYAGQRHLPARRGTGHARSCRRGRDQLRPRKRPPLGGRALGMRTGPSPAGAIRRKGYRAVLTDRGNIALAAMNVIATLLVTAPLLAMPILVIDQLHFAVWLPALLGALNTVTIAVPTFFVARLLGRRSSLTALVVASVMWAAGCLTYAIASLNILAIVLLPLGIVALGLGEAAYAPSANSVPLALAPAGLSGRYTAVHQLGWGISAAIAPVLAAGFLAAGGPTCGSFSAQRRSRLRWGTPSRARRCLSV